MITQPLISICIPAYKRVDYLKRLIKSISIQTYLFFEVVITDDSGQDNSVEEYIKTCSYNFNIVYKKNIVPLGSPLNWVESFKHAKGDWIKIMHDDDCFNSKIALETFVNAIDEKIDCIFSGYVINNESTNKKII
jgi:glycosyltransferase involved in cell wall biosynthesis